MNDREKRFVSRLKELCAKHNDDIILAFCEGYFKDKELREDESNNDT
jgi:hypothetical protein